MTISELKSAASGPLKSKACDPLKSSETEARSLDEHASLSELATRLGIDERPSGLRDFVLAEVLAPPLARRRAPGAGDELLRTLAVVRASLATAPVHLGDSGSQ